MQDFYLKMEHFHVFVLQHLLKLVIWLFIVKHQITVCTGETFARDEHSFLHVTLNKLYM